MSAGIGHNNGPTMEGGESWRRYAWGRARSELLPTLPIEVLRTRVKRAEQLGLPYRTYASIRASSGRDVIAFLFSSNALGLWRSHALPEDREARLRKMAACTRVAAVHAPLDPARLSDPVDTAARAPHPLSSWTDLRAGLRSILTERSLAPGATVVVGATALEEEWLMAAKAAAYLPAERFFAP